MDSLFLKLGELLSAPIDVIQASSQPGHAITTASST